MKKKLYKRVTFFFLYYNISFLKASEVREEQWYLTLVVLAWCISCDSVLTMHECMKMIWSLRRAPEVVILYINRLCYSQWMRYIYYFPFRRLAYLPPCDANLNFLSNHNNKPNLNSLLMCSLWCTLTLFVITVSYGSL